MKNTPMSYLLALGGFFAAATFIVVSRFYGLLGPVPISVLFVLFGLTVLCVCLGIRVRNRVKDNKIGQDRSQLNPVAAAQFMVIGKASAWTGALFGGVYTGMAIYVVPRMGQLAVAQQEGPVIIIAALGSVALAAAGVWLERSCSVPPPTEGEPVG